MTRITDDPGLLLNQSSMTADKWMHDAIRGIDQAFGDGFAAKNPALVGQYMDAAAKDFTTAVLCVRIENAIDAAQCTAEAIVANEATTDGRRDKEAAESRPTPHSATIGETLSRYRRTQRREMQARLNQLIADICGKGLSDYTLAELATVADSLGLSDEKIAREFEAFEARG